MDKLKTQNKFEAITEITSLTSSFMPAQIVLTANRLDLFSKLASKKLSAKDLASVLHTDVRATGYLCNALTALGFLEKESDQYRNSPKADEFLVKGRPYYVGDNLRHQAYLWERWSKLVEVVKTGKPIPKMQGSEPQNKQQIRDFILAMANIGQLSAQQVVDGLDLRGVKKIIDIGGGPGTYAIEFVRKNPHIQAVIFDLPDVIEIARENIQQNDMGKQVATKVGDLFVDDFGSGYDLALLSNIIHMISFEEVLFLLKKVRRSLNTKGRVVIKDFFVNEDRTGPVFVTRFAINMLVNTNKGNTYTFSEINRVFTEAGFEWVNSFEVGQNSSVIVGEKAD